SAGLTDLLRQQRLGERLDPPTPVLAFRAEQFDDLPLGAGFLLLGRRALDELSEIEALERRQTVLLMETMVRARQRGDVHQRLGHRAAFRSRAIAVVLLGNVLRDQDRVLAHGAKAVGELPRSVETHWFLLFTCLLEASSHNSSIRSRARRG